MFKRPSSALSMFWFPANSSALNIKKQGRNWLCVLTSVLTTFSDLSLCSDFLLTLLLWHYARWCYQCSDFSLSLWHYVTMSLWQYVTMSLSHFCYTLWHYVTMSLWQYVTMSLSHFCYTLCHYVTMSLCQYHIMTEGSLYVVLSKWCSGQSYDSEGPA